jgi:hypothetical protein
VYFDNQTGSAPVGDHTLAELKKWGKFQIVSDRKLADLILVLSSDSKLGGNIILSGGQTGTIDSTGHVTEDSVPVYLPPTSTRYAYLNVIDATTGEKLWGAEHVWGGLLTGFNSVGTHLIRELEKQTKK